MKRLILLCSILAACGDSTPPTTCEERMGLNVNFEGVYRGPNRHSQVPPGAAEKAENIVSYNKGEAECVEGMETLAGTYTTAGERFSSGIPYDGYIIERSDTGALYRRDAGAGTVTAVISGIDPPDGVERVPFTEAGGDLYLATDKGVKVMDGGTATPANPGLPPAFAPYYAYPGTGTGTFLLAVGESVAYRAEIRRRTAEGDYIISIPSGRSVALNNLVAVSATGTVTLAGGAGDVTIVTDGTSVGPVAFNTSDAQTAADWVTAANGDATFAAKATASNVDEVITITWDTAGTVGNTKTLTASRTAGTATASGATLAGGDDEDTEVTTQNFLPTGLTIGDEFRLYRTGTAAVGVNAGDVMYLVHVAYLASGHVTSRYYEWTDDTPDALRGEPLYTNATQGGILRQNERPPLAGCVTSFDDYLLACNVTGPQRFSFRMLAIPDNGDIITVAGREYTATTGSEDTVNGFFHIDNDSATASEQIANTALSLVKVINAFPFNTLVYALYASSENSAPGIIQLEARPGVFVSFGTAVNANPDRYEPPLNPEQESLATTEPSGIWVSKRGEHYAFPPLRSSNASYRFRAGSKGKDILAAVPLREAVIVFTNGEGIFKVQRVGNELWRADQINGTTQLLVPGSVAVVDNQVIALTTRGVVAVDTSGVEEIDLPIKDAVKEILALESSVLTAHTFAVGDDARNRYTLYHPASNADTYATHAWVYNGTTGTWTERTDPATGGFVDDSTGLLYLGSATSNTLTRERTGTAAQVYKRPDNTAIPFRLEWTVMDEGDPGMSKQYSELRLLTKDAFEGNVTFNCTNDLGGTESTTAVATDEPFARAWVPDGCQWTSRLKVDIQRDVLEEPFTVVGMKTILAGMEDGSFTR